MNIYTIYKATNKITGKCYIGFDSNYPERVSEHLKGAFNKNNTAYSTIFYKSIRKHGKENFDWEIQYQSREKHYTLNVMENHFINEYRSYIKFNDCNGYNMTLGGEGTFGKILSNYKSYKFLEEDKIIEIVNLKQFCELNNLNYNCMVLISTGKKKSYKGYRNTSNIDYIIPKIHKNMNYKIINPKGKIITLNNPSEFCIKNKLSYSCILRIISGECKYYKGYRNIKFPHYVPQKGKPYYFYDSNKNIIQINHLKQFCSNNNLNYTCMRDVSIGKQKSHKGYFTMVI